MLSRGRPVIVKSWIGRRKELVGCLKCTSFVVSPNSRQPYAFAVVLILAEGRRMKTVI
jgi:hypothetical protein